jgi:hypothetical protein
MLVSHSRTLISDYSNAHISGMLVWDRKPADKSEPINWVELKTSQEIQSEWDHDKFEKKLLRIWIQSFLLGVPKVIVGFRSKTGQLLRLEEYMTQGLPGYVKRHKASWNGNSCVNFAATFLDCESISCWSVSRHAANEYHSCSTDNHNRRNMENQSQERVTSNCDF